MIFDFPLERVNRPNFLFIFDDQHRHDYLGAAGASRPNLDRIAAQGMRFTQATTNAPACGPSRMAPAMGLRAVRAGVLNNGLGCATHEFLTLYQRLHDAFVGQEGFCGQFGGGGASGRRTRA